MDLEAELEALRKQVNKIEGVVLNIAQAVDDLDARLQEFEVGDAGRQPPTQKK